MDFYQITHRTIKRGLIEVYPDFRVCRSKDLMVRGKAFYAIWDDEKGFWSTDEYDIQRLVDKDLAEYRDRLQKNTDDAITVKWMSSFSSGSWTAFKKYVTQVSDNSHQLDNRIIFANTPVKKKDYASRSLPYSLEKGDYSAYDELIGTLYEPDERAKLEWAIGAIISGDARDIQKFIVLYGEAGAGKSTILNIVQRLFEGYYTTFDAKALTSTSNAFATEVFKTNPLVAIQHDGDLSKIEDNTKLNSIVSHEEMTMNEKYKSSYTARTNCFLFMATNRPVKITDAKSGIIRRLIDVKPSGNKVSPSKYQVLMSQIDFELGAIAQHCLEVYQQMGKDYYSAYRPLDMIFQTDVFFNFVEANFDLFKEQDGISLKQAYDVYKQYCDEALVEFKLPRHKFREELKNYFQEFSDVARIDGKQVRSYYSKFIKEKFTEPSKPSVEDHPSALVMDCTESLLDEMLADCPAQYATIDGKPMKKWDDVKTKLSDLDTHKLHYVKPPLNLIIIDFDLKDQNGNKSPEKNMEAASKWPLTYAEYSQSGAGIHLHYFYPGDPMLLSRTYDDGIEIKVYSGNSSLRRKVSKCNNIPVATINSGLPTKGETMINFDAVKSEKALRTLIRRNLEKEYHGGTKPSIDFIKKILDDVYSSGMPYDVTDLRNKVLSFAANSTNHPLYCMKLVNQMHFKSEDPIPSGPDMSDRNTLVFFDVEVFPNLFLVNWKYKGKDKTCNRMINPTPDQIEDLFSLKLVGFNCRRYDNHILYARYLGYTNEQLFELSKKIVNKSKHDSDKSVFFGEAYNISYTDIYDFASAGNKQSLKKWEIDLGLKHHELGLPWDQPVPEEQWHLVSEYCDDDVIASEAVFDHLSADWTARQILADLAGMTVNDTTNTLTTAIIFEGNKKPQSAFNYRDLSQPVNQMDDETKEFLQKACPEMMMQTHGPEHSLLPYFPGYTFENGVSTYHGEVIGEGGRVYAEPGMYGNVALLDVSSMHPHSVIAEVLFGVEFTRRFKEIVDGRVSIKHEAWDEVNNMLDGKLTPYIQKVINGEMTSDDLANGLKTAINSVYGLTSAKFENAFHDSRNKDNIVAKRGALFMVDLTEAVQKRGFQVVHIKTDSIKIPDATPEIIAFVMGFGLRYGYTFEHEATYDRMCLVNDAVYIAKYASAEKCQEMYGYVPKKNAKHPLEWTATGAQFAQPYVFKKLFSHEPIDFQDMCETKSVTTALYLDMNESLPDVSVYETEYENRHKNTKSKPKLNPNLSNFTDEELLEEIGKGHNYQFVGKVGQFTPIKPGEGGGLLLREKDGKYNSAPNAKDYRWLESHLVEALGYMDKIDKSYYDGMVNEAVEDISEYGDFEWFVSDDPYISHRDSSKTPPWLMPCGEERYPTCFDCPAFQEDNNHMICQKGYDITNIISLGR